MTIAPVLPAKGTVDVPAVLAELDRQGYEGYFVIEYEADYGKNINMVNKPLDYLRAN